MTNPWGPPESGTPDESANSPHAQPSAAEPGQAAPWGGQPSAEQPTGQIPGGYVPPGSPQAPPPGYGPSAGGYGSGAPTTGGYGAPAGQQPTQALPPQPAYGATGPATQGPGGQAPGAYGAAGGYGAGGYNGTGYGGGQQPGGWPGGPGGPEPKKSKTGIIIAAIIGGLIVVGGLVFLVISLIGGSDDAETSTEPTTETSEAEPTGDATGDATDEPTESEPSEDPTETVADELIIYTSPEHGFTVQLPVEPSVDTSTSTSGGMEETLTTYSAQRGFGQPEYIVEVYEYSESPGLAGYEEDAFDLLATEMDSRPSVELLDETSGIQFNGFPAREFHLSYPIGSRDADMYYLAFIENDRIWTLFTGDLDRTGFDAFLDSFNLN